MRLHVLQHVAFEDAAQVGDWARARGYAVETTRLYDGQRPPGLGAFDWLAVMGGPMNIYDEAQYPWLVEEKDFLRRAVAAHKPILGVCLGAQLLSDVLGGGVSPNPEKEIGWHGVALTGEGRLNPFTRHWPEKFTPFHWHGDAFAIPPGAVHLAGSTACRNQAFAYRDFVVGLQFHIDYRADSIRLMLKHCSDELEGGGAFVQPAERIEGGLDRASALRPLLDGLLAQLFT